MKKKNKKLKLSDIGYYGKPVSDLTVQDLQNAFLDIAQQSYDCDSKDNDHNDIK